MTKSIALDLLRMAALREAERWIWSVLWSKQRGMAYGMSLMFAIDNAEAALIAERMVSAKQ